MDAAKQTRIVQTGCEGFASSCPGVSTRGTRFVRVKAYSPGPQPHSRGRMRSGASPRTREFIVASPSSHFRPSLATWRPLPSFSSPLAIAEKGKRNNAGCALSFFAHSSIFQGWQSRTRISHAGTVEVWVVRCSEHFYYLFVCVHVNALFCEPAV